MVSGDLALPGLMSFGNSLLLGLKFCRSDLVNNYVLICRSKEKKKKNLTLEQI